MNFLYVFSEEDRDILLAQGYTLLQSNNTTHTYIFANDCVNTRNFTLENVKHVFSNILTF